MKEEGIKFETNSNIGEDISAKKLKKDFDAVILTVGAGQPRDLQVPGRELNGIYFAMEYLTKSNEYVAGDAKKSEIISAKNKNVLVIGGGDTGSDCIGTANRQGAKNVYQYEIMPKPQDWQEDNNPVWPEWPVILRTSSSHKEGAERDWAISTKKFNGTDKVESAEFARIEWKKEEGQRPSMEEIAGSEFALDVDLVFLAMGFVHVEHNKLVDDLKVELDQRGNIKTDHYATSVKGIYAAGDSDTGASLVVRAIGHGRNAAEEINNYLKK
jgi:glutamate synthase (NADPH/NADH) small chain